MGADATSAYFARPDWQPLAAVGAHSPTMVNAQICVSILGASIVPERPRLIVELWNTNLTHDLVAASGSLSVTLLTAQQLSYLETLGVRSGHDGPKLAGLELEYTGMGDPIFPGGAGWADCRVIDAIDLGDATAYVCGVAEEGRFSLQEPMTWAEAQRMVDSSFLDRYEQQFQRNAAEARRSMRWLP